MANGEKSFWLFTLGRWACVPFSVIGACVSYRWANELFGQTSAYAALSLWCFSPNVLAHAQLLTPDIGVTALCLSACYSFWCWSRHPTWAGTFFWGVTLGLAVLAKTNAVVLYVAFQAAMAFDFFVLHRSRNALTIQQLAVGFVTSIYVINLGYGFEGTCRPLGEYTFVSNSFTGDNGVNRFTDSFLGSVPVLVPAPFLEGIDLQRRDFENTLGTIRTYLRGRWYDHSWWWFYFYAALVKAPIGTLTLCVVSLCVHKRHPNFLPFVAYAAIPAVLLFALASSQTGFGLGLRYVLPAFPFAFLLASATFSGRRFTIRFLASTLLLTSAVWSSLRVYPHSLSYFNEFAGGPQNGHYHLLDGSLDYGQDLLFIRDWLEKHRGEKPIYAAYWGFLPIDELGIQLDTPVIPDDAPIPPGTYVISVNFLRGDYRLIHSGLERFLQHTPQDIITPAVYVFRIPDSSLPAQDNQ